MSDVMSSENLASGRRPSDMHRQSGTHRQSSGAASRAISVIASGLIPFGVFLVLDGWFFSDPFLASHLPLSLFFAFAPIVGLYLGWPAIIGCLAAEAIVCLPNHVTVTEPTLWCAGLVIYVALPYLGWYWAFRHADDPYPRCADARQVRTLLLLFLASSLAFGLLAAMSAALPDTEGTYLWNVITVFMPYSSLTITLGILLLVIFEMSPAVPRAPRWIAVAYVRHPMLTLTQRLVLVFAAVTSVMLVGLVGSMLGFIATPGESFDIIVSIIVPALLIGDVAAIVLWVFVILILNYLQTRFTMPIERLTEATLSFQGDIAEYQRVQDEGAAVAELEAAKARAADPVDMDQLKPSGEVAYLVIGTDEMRSSIVRYLDEMRTVTAENERVRAELDIASQIQQGAVPHDFGELERQLGVQVTASMTPARDVGGDFYDAFRVDATHLGVIMADVSGKGMPAALFMMRALADLREQMRSHPDDVGLALTQANQALCSNNDAMLFVTALIGVLDVESGRLAYANAGHNPAWILGGQGGWLQARKGLVLGVMDMVAYQTETLDLAPGGGLFLYTDGVTEAMDDAEALYGEDRLEAVLTRVEQGAHGEASTEDLVRDVLDDVQHFVDGAPQSDDITALAFRWLPRS